MKAFRALEPDFIEIMKLVDEGHRQVIFLTVSTILAEFLKSG